MADGVSAPIISSTRSVKPKAASSLILVDTTQSVPRVLMGRRNASLRFMPDKFVFPGGRVEREDRDITAADTLNESVATRLGKRNRRDAPEPRTLALAAIRETFEETGLLIGEKATPSKTPVPQSWRAFVELGFLPRIGDLRFLARAVTPQHLPRRFDTRFFIANAASIAYRVEGVAHADAELVELRWLPIAEASELDVGNITSSILREAAQRITAGLTADPPAAFFTYRNRRFSRDEL
ncbi:MAG: NUDIX hydrolase [Methylovirgula sp.]|uniref:NUDIX hydrolase n=1 Tax=Methylovirgula sp. TaxID=1978224 RepID=UPI0030760F8E